MSKVPPFANVLLYFISKAHGGLDMWKMSLFKARKPLRMYGNKIFRYLSLPIAFIFWFGKRGNNGFAFKWICSMVLTWRLQII